MKEVTSTRRRLHGRHLKALEEFHESGEPVSKPHGRFVAEFGGHGCVAKIGKALVEALNRRGTAETFSPWGYRLDSEAQPMEGN